ncbi:uncharacterized protein BXZ73DRAFT_107976 [Epithele typhae]|uniref:uncharacterized protein n=1 Tax=Epithele typhae TaxID=378194 RepID=UPI0020077D7C|nr:uncharacterized protein BXZ73DRAFT_107976 [Epithele typhae]KAH9911469.1 hypothetical protein BXZ73DRAFT_107976 [Epithele typhae]
MEAEAVNELAKKQTASSPSLPPRGAKAKALLNKVWTSDAPAPRNKAGKKRALPDEVTEAATTVTLTPSTRSRPKPRHRMAVNGRDESAKTKEGLSSNADALSQKGTKGGRSRGAAKSADGDSETTTRPAEPPSKRQKLSVRHRAADRKPEAEKVSEDCPKASSGSEEDQSVSSEDDIGVNNDWAELTAEKAAWSDDDHDADVQSSGDKGKGRQTYITLDDLEESSISGSEFRPEDSVDHESSAESSEVQVFDPDSDFEAFDPDAWMTDEEYTHEKMVANLAKDEERRKAEIVRRRKAEKEKECIRHEKARKEDEEPLWLDVPPKRSSSSQAAKASNKLRTASASTPALGPQMAQSPATKPSGSRSAPILSTISTNYSSEDDDEEDDEDIIVEALGLVPSDLPPMTYAVVPSANPGGVLSLTSQHIHVRDTLRVAFELVREHVLSENAFPDTVGRHQFVTASILRAAQTRGYNGLAGWFTSNPDELRALAPIVNQRICSIRNDLKKASDNLVVGFFKIVSGDETKQLIKWLLQHLNYSYPVEPMQATVPRNKPYQHPSISAILATVFFKGRKPHAKKHASIFKSTSPDRPEEKEIPMTMVALVSTAIHSSLMDWSQGTHQPTYFTADKYLDAYNEHVFNLEQIKARNPRGYHKTMHGLYVAAGGSIPPRPADMSANIAMVDYDNMDVD